MASDDIDNCYDILGIEPDASASEIQKAYLTVAIQYHPDRTENQDGRNSATFEKINAAYREVISDEDAENVDSDQVFFNLLEELLLSDSEVTDVYSWFSQPSPGFSPDDMYIDDVDDDAAERGFDTFMDIVHNRRLNGKQVPEGFTDEKLSYLKDTLAEEKEAHKRENAKRLNSKKSKTVLPVPVAKPKPKSKKQLKAEQRRREKEMEEIAHDLKEKAKEEELRAEKKKQQELEKQKRLEEEYIKAAQEEKKRKEKEAEELRLQMEEEEEQRQEEERRKREEKKKKQQQLKAKAQELKAKEAESAKSQPSQAQPAQQAAKRPSSAQGQQPPRYPREVPPRFQQQAQKQQHHKQKQQGGQGKKQQDYYKGSGDNDFSMWNDTGSSWDRVVVDGKDKESWPSLNNESETTSEVDDSLSNAGSDKSASNSSSLQGLSQHSDGQRDDSSLSPRDTDLSSGNATPSASSSGPLNETIANANPRGMNGNTDSVWGSSSAKTVSTSGTMSVWGMQGAATNVSNVNSSVWGGNPHGFPNVQNNDNSVVARDANSGTSNSMFMGMWDSDSNSDGNYQQNVLQLGRKEAAQQQPPPHVFGVHNALPQTINNPGSGPNTQNYGNPQVNANAAMESAKCELLPVSNGWLGGFSTAGETNPGAPGHNNLVDGPAGHGVGMPPPPASNPGNTSAASTNLLFGGSNMNTSVAGTADSANAANITTNMGNNLGNQSRTEPNAWSRPLSGADWGNPSRAWGNTNPTPGVGGSGWGSPPPQMPSAAPQVGPSGWGDSNPRSQENSWANAAKKGMAPENFTNGAKTLARPNPDSELRAKIDSTTSWGKTPVKQDTAWAVADSPEEKRADDGTAIWGRPSAASGGRDWDDKNWDDNKGSSWGGGGGGGPAQPPPPARVDNGTAVWGRNQRGSTSTSPPTAPTTTTITVTTTNPIPAGPTGWEEPSPPTMRRMMEVDNGTAAWGDPEAHNRRVSELGKRGQQLSVSALQNTTAQMNVPKSPDTGTKGWSEPPPTPSAFKPSGWGDTPTSVGSPYDKGTSIWGGKTSSSSWGDPGDAAWGTSVSSTTHSKSGSESMQDGWGTEGEGSSTPGWEEDEAFGTWSVSASQESNSSYGSGGWTNVGGKKKVSAKPVVKDSSMWNNRQLKQLVDMGFPREDAEKALKTNNNNLESAIGVLLQKNGVESNSHLDSDSGKDRNTNRVLPVGRQKRYSSRADDQIPVPSHDEDDSSAFIPISQPNQILKNPSPIPPGQQAGLNKQGVNYNFSLNQNSGAMSSITSSSATPTLPKGGGGSGGGGGVGFNPQQPLTPPMNPNQPIRGQMNPLVFQQQMQQHMQMLQMAARNGFLNQALLNPQVAAAASANSGPMSQQVTSLTPQQLKLVQQLLQLSQLQNQQKVLNQQLLQYQGQQGGTGKGSLNHLQRQQQELAMLIQQMQQQIVNQQRLIAQQSLMQQKQNQKPDHHFGVEPRDQERVGNNVSSALGNLNLNMDAGMKEPPLSQSTMQSRLNQWKHPSHQPREDSNDDFGRKPGAIGRSRSQNNSTHGYGGGPYDSFPPEDPLNHTTVTSPIMSTQSDTWSAISPSPTDASSRSSSQQWSSAIDADLSSMLPPEFKPGEPWKGLKDYANDPDVTPGSVARSISLNMVKDSDILKLTGEQYKSSKDDPASSTSALLSSTTWSFSGSSLYSNTSASGSNKGNVKSTWSSSSPLSPSAYPPSTITNEIWRAPLPSKKGVVPARPPPGLNVTKSSMWSSGGGGGRGNSGEYNVGGSGGSGGSGWGSVPSMWSGGDTAPPGRQAPSNWLILKNLTPQIDGSTLRTLCMQHGPLLTFHLNLSQGCALVCYMSKEEAAKAQKSLHTCVLGNTTILADFISEDEARRLFEQNNSQAASSSSGDRYSDRYNPSFGGRGDGQHYIGRGDGQTYPGRGENQSYGSRGENRAYGGRGDAQAYGRRNDPPPFSGPPSDSHWNGSSSVGGLSSMIPGNSMWSIQAGSSGGGGWGTGNDTDARGVVSPNALSTLLPGDLLGGENM